MSTDTHGGERRSNLWKVPALVAALLLLVPLLRNLLVYGWDWDLRGFVVVASFGTLLFGVGLTVQLFWRKLGTPMYRAAVGVALAAAFALVWGNFVQAADDVNRAAMMFLWVPPVGMVGAALARFRPDGMARALYVMALAQALILAIVLMLNPPVAAWAAAVWRGFGMNAVLVAVFAGSAWLFRMAGRGESAPGAA